MVDDSSLEADDFRQQMDEALRSGLGPNVGRFALSVLGGLVPFGGGVLGGAADAWSERNQQQINRILAAWLKLQEDELKEIGNTLAEVMARIDTQDDDVLRRVESPEYLSLVRKCFRDWSAAESEQKRVYLRNLLANAASCRLTSDDVLRLFVQWIDEYSEAHFAVVKDVYRNHGATRADTWQRIHGAGVREDSAEADLFKLLYRDLSTGGIIRQIRAKDAQGNFYKQPSRSRSLSRYTVSAFDDGKPYELTELGSQFVHYTMNEIVPKIAEPSAQQQQASKPR